MDANLAAVIAEQDTVILGRRSYDEWAEFWTGSEIEPFATFINGVATRYEALRAYTSPGPTSGTGTSVMCTTSGGPYVVRTAALMALIVTAAERPARRLPGIESGGGGSATGATE